MALRDWGKVATSFWERGSGKRLRGDHEAALTALQLVTSQWANSLGVFYIPLPAIAHAIGSPLEGATEALARVIGAGFAQYDLASELVWVPNHAEIEIGETLKAGDKRKPHIQSELNALGNHPFALAFWEKYGVAYGLDKPKPLASPFEGPWEPLQTKNEAPPKPKQSKAKQKQEYGDPGAEEKSEGPTPIAQVRRAFLDGYAARYPNAKPYPWGLRENGQAKNWLASVPLDEALELVEWYFSWKRPEVIKAGHPWGTTAVCLVMKYHELRADLAHPERRAFAAVTTDTERIDERKAQSDAQDQRVLKALEEKRNAIGSGNERAQVGEDHGRNLQPSHVRLGGGNVGRDTGAASQPRTDQSAQRRVQAVEDAWNGRDLGDDDGGEEA